jgi:hypothetical protein
VAELEELNQRLISYLKFHCELTFIKRFWCVQSFTHEKTVVIRFGHTEGCSRLFLVPRSIGTTCYNTTLVTIQSRRDKTVQCRNQKCTMMRSSNSLVSGKFQVRVQYVHTFFRYLQSNPKVTRKTWHCVNFYRPSQQ